MRWNSTSRDGNFAEQFKHLLLVCPGPIAALAVRTPGKSLFRRKDIRRHEIRHGLFRSRLKQRIALKTPSEQRSANIQPTFSHYLAQLFAIVIACNHDKRRRLFLFQAPVAGENHTLLCPRRPDQAVAGQVRAIDHIATEYSEPLDQPSEHPVGGKFVRALARCVGFIGLRH